MLQLGAVLRSTYNDDASPRKKFHGRVPETCRALQKSVSFIFFLKTTKCDTSIFFVSVLPVSFSVSRNDVHHK